MLALFASLVLLPGGGEREARVLEIVRELEGAGAGTYGRTHIVRVEPPFGDGPAFDARATFLCGNSDNGSFDDAAARALVVRLGAIYGLRFRLDIERRIGSARAVLDGLDSAAGIGFELRGRRGNGREALDEPLEDTLDEFEWRVLASQGVRVHLDDARRYRVTLGCDFSDRMAYLAGVIAFLNEVTEGEDVEFGGLCFEQEARWQPKELEASGAWLPPLAPLFESERVLEFRLEVAGTVRIHARGQADFTHEPESAFLDEFTGRSAAQRAWAGDRRAGPALLALELYGEALEAADENYAPLPWRARWLQSHAQGELEVQTSPDSNLLFLPAEADLTRPFTLVLELAAGSYRLYGARIGVSATPHRSERSSDAAPR